MAIIKKPTTDHLKKKFVPAIITIDPTSGHAFDLRAGDVNVVQLFDALHLAQSVYRDKLIEDYKKETGDKSVDDAKFDKWIVKKRA